MARLPGVGYVPGHFVDQLEIDLNDRKQQKLIPFYFSATGLYVSVQAGWEHRCSFTESGLRYVYPNWPVTKVPPEVPPVFPVKSADSFEVRSRQILQCTAIPICRCLTNPLQVTLFRPQFGWVDDCIHPQELGIGTPNGQPWTEWNSHVIGCFVSTLRVQTILDQLRVCH